MNSKICVYDLETTGLDPKTDAIIEFGILEIDTNRVYDSDEQGFSSLVYSETVNSAVDINHITPEMYQSSDTPTLTETITRLLDFIGTNPCYLIAHNNDNFDKLFLTCALHSLGKNIPDNWIFVDSLKIARTIWPEWKRHNQKSILKKLASDKANNFNIEGLLLGSHRSLDDVRCLKKLIEYWLKDFSMEDLSRISYEYRMSIMPFGKHKGKHLETIPPDYLMWMASQGILNRDIEISRGLWKYQPQSRVLLKEILDAEVIQQMSRSQPDERELLFCD